MRGGFKEGGGRQDQVRSNPAEKGGEVLAARSLIEKEFLEHFDISIGSTLTHKISMIRLHIRLPTRSSFTVLAQIHQHVE